MADAITCNILIIICIWLFATLSGPTYRRAEFGVAVGRLAAEVSLLGWVIFVVAHFVVKYW